MNEHALAAGFRMISPYNTRSLCWPTSLHVQVWPKKLSHYQMIKNSF